jgi:hypothetical protein
VRLRVDRDGAKCSEVDRVIAADGHSLRTFNAPVAYRSAAVCEILNNTVIARTPVSVERTMRLRCPRVIIMICMIMSQSECTAALNDTYV